MVSPQKENGYTIIANEIIEALARIRIPGECRQILDVVFRQTYGYHRTSFFCKPGELSEKTGIRRQHINRSLKKLAEMNLLTVTNNGYVTKNGYAYEITFNKDYEKWAASPKKVTYPIMVTPVTNNGSPTYKRKIKENNIYIQSSPPLKKYPFPEWLDKKLWGDFCRMRSRIRKPITTERTIDGLIKKLSNLIDQGHNQEDLIQNAIDNCWMTFYPPKTGQGRSNNCSNPSTYSQKQEAERRAIARALIEDSKQDQGGTDADHQKSDSETFTQGEPLLPDPENGRGN